MDVSWTNWLPVLLQLPFRLQNSGSGKEQYLSTSSPLHFPTVLPGHVLREQAKNYYDFSGYILFS